MKKASKHLYTYIEVRSIAAVVHETVVQGLGDQLVAPVGVQTGRDDTARYHIMAYTTL
jgi:hypothetical protein